MVGMPFFSIICYSSAAVKLAGSLILQQQPEMVTLGHPRAGKAVATASDILDHPPQVQHPEPKAYREMPQQEASSLSKLSEKAIDKAVAAQNWVSTILNKAFKGLEWAKDEYLSISSTKIGIIVAVVLAVLFCECLLIRLYEKKNEADNEGDDKVRDLDKANKKMRQFIKARRSLQEHQHGDAPSCLLDRPDDAPSCLPFAVFQLFCLQMWWMLKICDLCGLYGKVHARLHKYKHLTYI